MAPRRTSSGRRLGLVAAALAVLAAGCAGDTPQNTLDPEGPFARSVDELIQPVFLIAALVFVFVEGLIVFAVVKFRRTGDDDRPEQIHGSTKFELAWTIAPALILVLVGALTVSKIFYLDRQFKDALQVEVIGHQWWWEYNYKDADGKTTVAAANELHIPVGRKVQLNITSADVIHNYWPPALAGKIYAIPGRSNHMTIQADKADFYYGQCTEYCGMSHANMRLRVVSQEQADFDRWMEANSVDRAAPSFPIVAGEDAASASEEAKGHTVFLQKGCSGCHAVNNVARGAVGPNLTYFNSRATFAGAIFENNDDNLRAWLRDPPAEKPGSLMPRLNLSEGEITSLIAYLRILGDADLRGAPIPAGVAAGPPQP
jgi:cytochrome c oxidase subunit 2